jgi:hypothetical protein
VDPTEYPWCPEIVEIMANYGQTPANMIVSDDDSEEGSEIDMKVSSLRHNGHANCKHPLLCHRSPNCCPGSPVIVPSLKIKIRAGATNNTALHEEDDTEHQSNNEDAPDSEVAAKDESDSEGEQKSEPSDTQELPTGNRKRRRNSSNLEDVEIEVRCLQK